MSAVSSLKEAIKNVGFRVFAFAFDCGARLPVKKDRVVLFNLMHGGFEGALTETERELAAYAPLDLVKVDRNDLERGIGPMLRFMTKDAFTMGRAKTFSSITISSPSAGSTRTGRPRSSRSGTVREPSRSLVWTSPSRKMCAKRKSARTNP